MGSRSDTGEGKWIDGRQASDILGGVTTEHINTFVKLGLLSVRDLPGVRKRFNRAEVEELAMKSVRRKEVKNEGG
jgi:predicted site-specific integrase-resolvase